MPKDRSLYKMFSKSGSHFKHSFWFTFSFIVVLAIGEIPQIRMLFLRGYHLEKNCVSLKHHQIKLVSRLWLTFCCAYIACGKQSVCNHTLFFAECVARKRLKPCNKIRDRETCLRAFDTRAGWRGPCGWCAGKHCPKSINVCEPLRWFQKRKLVVGIHYADCLKKGKEQRVLRTKITGMAKGNPEIQKW